VVKSKKGILSHCIQIKDSLWCLMEIVGFAELGFSAFATGHWEVQGELSILLNTKSSAIASIPWGLRILNKLFTCLTPMES